MTPMPLKRPLVLWIIHHVFMISIAMYFIAYELAIKNSPQEAMANLPPIVFFGAILAFAAGDFVFVRFTRTMFAKQTAQASASDFIARHQLEMIVADALYESVALFGLVGAIALDLVPWQVYGSFLLSLALISSQNPWLKSMLDEYERRQAAERNET